MTTPIGHSLLALTVCLFRGKLPNKLSQWLIPGLIFFVAVAPDLDFLPILWQGYKAGMSYHQGFSHSILFGLFSTTLALAIVYWLKLYPIKKALVLFSAAAASHILLDYFTHDGRAPYGIPLLWPFSDARFTSPVSLFSGFSKGSLAAIFSWQNLVVLGGELLVTGSLFAVVYLLLRKREL
jgi:inner membrane protein